MTVTSNDIVEEEIELSTGNGAVTVITDRGTDEVEKETRLAEL